MKIRFNGTVEKRTHGCKVCGQRTTSDYSFVNRRSYFVPSGKSIYVVAGEEYEMSDGDAEFLLSYSYTDSKGVVQHVFEVV